MRVSWCRGSRWFLPLARPLRAYASVGFSAGAKGQAAQVEDENCGKQQTERQRDQTRNEGAGASHKVAHQEGTGKTTQIAKRVNQSDRGGGSGGLAAWSSSDGIRIGACRGRPTERSATRIAENQGAAGRLNATYSIGGIQIGAALDPPCPCHRRVSFH